MGLPEVEAKESETVGLPEVNSDERFISSGLDIVPMDSLLEVVNGRLKDCKWCKGTPLVLKGHKRIIFASNWKLTCLSCDQEEKSINNTIQYLNRMDDTYRDHIIRRSVKKKLYKK